MGRIRGAAIAAVLVAQAAAIGLSGWQAPPAGAIADSAPLPTVGANGDVVTIASDATHVYLGGSFTYVGANSGPGVAVNELTGTRLATIARVRGGEIRAAVSDRKGGWYIGGSFTTVGGQTRNGLARILSTGALAAWAPSVTGRVDALAYDGGLVYVGGLFSQANGSARTNLAAIDGSTAVLSAWNPGSNGAVDALALDSSSVYVGGTFGVLGGSGRSNLGSFDRASGALGAWNPGVDGAVRDLVLQGGRLYVAGAFATVAAAPRANLAVFDVPALTLTAWNPGTDGPVEAVAARSDGAAVYAGGSFTLAGGAARSNLAALDPASGLATPWAPGTDGPVYDLELSRATGSRPVDAVLYLGGTFTVAAGVTRYNAAGVVTATGAPDTWDPGTDTTVRTVTRSGTTVFVGGSYTWVNGAPRAYVAALRADTLELDRAWNPGADAPVRSIDAAPDGSAVYVGGEFSVLGGASRSRAGALDPTTGTVTGWNPNVRSGNVSAVAAGTTSIFLGGTFATVGGIARSRIAAVDPTGALLTGWNPGSNNSVRFLELSPDETRLYAGGPFSSIGGAARPGCAELAAGAGTLTTFAPTNGGDVVSLDLSTDGQRLWCSTANNRTYMYAPLEGTNTPLWTVQTGGDVQAAADSATELYIGGHFGQVRGGGKRTHAASIDIATGATTAWNPSPYGAYGVWALEVVGGRVLMGGDFDTMGVGYTQPRFAAFAGTP